MKYSHRAGSFIGICCEKTERSDYSEGQLFVQGL